MRIAILGSIALPVPPPAQGGTEWIAYYQAIGLAEKGHDVILIAAKGTKKHFENTKVRVIEVGAGDLVAGSIQEVKIDPTLMEASRTLRLEMVYLAEVENLLIKHKEEYDVILNNMRGEAVFLPIVKLLKKPFTTVMHLNLFSELADFFEQQQIKVITISDAQRKQYPNVSYLATVYNCVDMKKYSFESQPNDYLLMVGTIGRHKNQKAAIEVAKRLGMKLILAGKIREKDYFDELEPFMRDGLVEYKGEMLFEEKLDLYQHAKALIFPIIWEEPFGLVMIEAMSCGTPVVAFNHGAVSEVVDNGKTGFIVNDEHEMVEAVKKIDTISREDCRKHVESHFTPEIMVDRLEMALQAL